MSEQPLQRQPDGTFAPGNGYGRWQPGESGNPGGMPAGTVQPGRWLRALADMTVAELRAVLADESASASKRGAALLLLDLCDEQGTPESRRRALAELLDRCEGKARQAIDVSADQRSAGVVYQITVAGESVADSAAISPVAGAHCGNDHDAGTHDGDDESRKRLESKGESSASATTDTVRPGQADTPLGTASPIRSLQGGDDGR